MSSKIRSKFSSLLFAMAIAIVSVFALASGASAQVVPVDAYATGTDNSVTATTTAPTLTNGDTSVGNGVGDGTTLKDGTGSGTGVTAPNGPTGPTGAAAGTTGASINLNLNSALNKPSQSILIIIVITLLSVAPALLIMLTSFTRIIIVLSLARNALGVTSIPPTQVLTGLALFLSLFIMTPTFTAMNKDAVQPYLAGKMDQKTAYNTAVKPLKTFMLKQTRSEELALFTQIQGGKKPANAESVGMQVLAPAFIVSEVKTAFIIGFIIFIPFLVIDLIVSSSLMAMGMMMLPPQMISLPFKILLFVLVDGWGLIIKALIQSFN